MAFENVGVGRTRVFIERESGQAWAGLFESRFR